MQKLNRMAIFPAMMIALIWPLNVSVRAEIVAPKDAPTQRAAMAREIDFHRKLIIEAYKTTGKHDPKWDADAIQFLTDAPSRLARLPDAPSLEELERRARSIYLAGCDDAMVRFYYGQVLERMGRHVESESREKGMALQVLKQGYPPAM